MFGAGGTTVPPALLFCCQLALARPPPVVGVHSNLKALSGVPDAYRVRFGDWRVSFTIDREADVMEVFEVAPRGGAYRW